jgi:uncharacterized protein (DUF1501 family)
MARKHPLKCAAGSKRFTVIRVDGDSFDTHAGRSFAQALAAAQPDRGAKLDVFVTCARDPGEARLPSNYAKFGRMVKTIRYKKGG